MSRITKKHLPPAVVRKPIQAHSERVKRVTSVFIMVSVLFLALFFFSEHEFTGKATAQTTANVTQLSSSNCTFDLSAGLNVVSFNCISNSQDRAEVLANTDTSRILAVYEYNNGQLDEWSVYNPNLPSYVIHDLDTFSRLKGYLFYIATGNGTLINYEGILALSSSIPLLSGNNLVGFPSVTNRTLPEGLTTINDTYTRIRTYNGSTWIEYNATDGAAGGLSNLTVYEGYWITMSTTDNWILGYNGT